MIGFQNLNAYIQNNMGNRFSQTVIVAAITSKIGPTHVSVDAEGLSAQSTVLTEQIRTIDKDRLLDYMGDVDDTSMRNIDRAIGTGCAGLSLELQSTQTWG